MKKQSKKESIKDSFFKMKIINPNQNLLLPVQRFLHWTSMRNNKNKYGSFFFHSASLSFDSPLLIRCSDFVCSEKITFCHNISSNYFFVLKKYEKIEGLEKAEQCSAFAKVTTTFNPIIFKTNR